MVTLLLDHIGMKIVGFDVTRLDLQLPPFTQSLTSLLNNAMHNTVVGQSIRICGAESQNYPTFSSIKANVYALLQLLFSLSTIILCYYNSAYVPSTIFECIHMVLILTNLVENLSCENLINSSFIMYCNTWNQYQIHTNILFTSQNMVHLVFMYLKYGSTGCGVFKRGIQNQKDFCIKINIPKGNY